MKGLWPKVWVAAILPLLGWWTYGLFDLDEGFYAAVVAEMNRRGEWVTPYFNGRPWFEKPVLLYWAAKPTLALFGEAFGARLPSILATALTTVGIAAILRRRVSDQAALWGALIFGGSLLPVAAGRMMLTDPLLVLSLSASFVLFFRSLEGDRHARTLSAACLGFAVLAKGPVAGILFLLTFGLLFWRRPELRPAYRGGWLVGTLAFLAVVGLWYLPAYLANGQLFVDKFLIEQNIGRFTGGDEAHTLPFFAGIVFNLVVLIAGMLPYSLRTVGALRSPSEDAFQTFLKLWFLAIFGFFTISAAKLPHYILPALPPLAGLLAIRLAERRGPSAWAWAWLVGMGIFAQFGFSLYYHGGTVFGQRVPGFHAEVHRLARYIRAEAAPTDSVAIFQMSRRDLDRGTGKPKIQETSHPSLFLVLDRTAFDGDDWNEILAMPRPVWILTRHNRIGPDEAATPGLRRVETPFEQDLYALYRLE